MSKPAARLGDMHVCPKVEPGPVPHVGGPLGQGSVNVLIGGMPAARMGDKAICVGPPDQPAMGSATVLINGKPAVRMGDTCSHGGAVVAGCPTVLIGDGGGAAVVPATVSTHLPAPPSTREEVQQRMERATRVVQSCREAGQPLPKSPFTTADKMRIVLNGEPEKFIVRVTKSKYATDEQGIGKPGGKTATYWTTPYTQLEHADKDAELIARAVGTDYDPGADYTLLLIDQEAANAQGDMVSFIPTYTNLGKFAQREVVDQFEGPEHLIEPSMTPECSRVYEKLVVRAKAKKLNLDNRRQFNELTSSLGFDEDQTMLLGMRHKMNNTLGANEQFLGNGMTRDNTANNPITPFGEPRVGQSFGPVETFTYDKNPQTLGVLEKAGIVTRIPLNRA